MKDLGDFLGFIINSDQFVVAFFSALKNYNADKLIFLQNVKFSINIRSIVSFL